MYWHTAQATDWLTDRISIIPLGHIATCGEELALFLTKPNKKRISTVIRLRIVLIHDKCAQTYTL